MIEFITVYEKLKSLSLDEMASLLSRMCKNSETCEGCPFETIDCPCSERESAWKEFLQREIPTLVPTQTNSAVCKLKPCPFCGGRAELKKTRVYTEDGVCVHCVGCHVHTMTTMYGCTYQFYHGKRDVFITKDMAEQRVIDLWNRRARK